MMKKKHFKPRLAIE